MSISAVSATTSVGSHASRQPSAPSKTPSAAKPVNAASAAYQEATETAAQTAKEARQGDRQAQRVLQKQAVNASQHAAPSHNGNAGSQSASPTVNASGQVTGTIVNTKS